MVNAFARIDRPQDSCADPNPVDLRPSAMSRNTKRPSSRRSLAGKQSQQDSLKIFVENTCGAVVFWGYPPFSCELKGTQKENDLFFFSGEGGPKKSHTHAWAGRSVSCTVGRVQATHCFA